MATERTNRYLRDIPLPGMGGPLGYRGPQVCKIVGITYRQLDYWTTTGLVTASVRNAVGSGSQRLYSFDDIIQLKVIKRLLDTGVNLRRIRSALEFVQERGLSLRNVTLMSDGETVYAADDDAQIVDLLRSGQGVFAIAVEPVVLETEAEVTAVPGERAHEVDDLAPEAGDEEAPDDAAPGPEPEVEGQRGLAATAEPSMTTDSGRSPSDDAVPEVG